MEPGTRDNGKAGVLAVIGVLLLMVLGVGALTVGELGKGPCPSCASSTPTPTVGITLGVTSTPHITLGATATPTQGLPQPAGTVPEPVPTAVETEPVPVPVGTVGALIKAQAADVIAGAPSVDDVQIRSYRDGWGVVVSVPTLGGVPDVSSFQIDPTPQDDRYRVGPYDVDVQWGAGPKGGPLVIVQEDGAGK
jgi:hypothetical protein